MSLTHPPTRIAPDHLPQDIIDAFINILSMGVDDQTHRDLVSCSQVSRAFRSQARKCLFSEILLVVQPGNDESNKSVELRRLFEVDDSPAYLIRTFALKVDAGMNSITHEQLLDKNLPFILNQLSGLRKFSLDMSKAGTCGWHAFDDSIKSAFLDLRTRQPIDTLELIGSGEVKLPEIIVTTWASVKNLKVVGSPIDSSDSLLESASVAQQGTVARLESLELHTLFNIDFLPIEMILGLKFLNATIESFSDYVTIWGILEVSCSSLETLVLQDALASFDSVPESHDLSDLRFPNLRHVEIREPHLNIPIDSVASLSEVIVVLASGDYITSMSLVLKFRHGLDNINRLYEVEYTDPNSWSDLDNTLAAARCFKRLDIEITFDYGFIAITRARRDRFMKAKQSWTSHNIFPRLSAIGASIIRLSAAVAPDFD